MKNFFASVIVSAAALYAQSANVSSTAVDINGRRISDAPQMSTTKSATGSDTIETSQSVNGRTVPLQRIEERVLRDDASGKVVERTIRNYDMQGNPTTPVKETIEQQKRPDGSSTTIATTYRGDINGRMQLAEKSVTELHKSGSEERSEKVVQRPTINGSLDTVEKQDQVKVMQSNGYREEATTYRRNGSGGFYTAVKTVTDHSQQGSDISDNTVEYEANPAGTLAMHGQTVTKTVTAADGSKDSVVDIYSVNVPGTVGTPGSALKLQERQVIQSQKGPNDTTTQTLSVRRPSVSDPTSLGPLQQLSQTVCKGDCKP